nr:hypothetical protein [uncultured Desulfobacter sp.]
MEITDRLIINKKAIGKGTQKMILKKVAIFALSTLIFFGCSTGIRKISAYNPDTTTDVKVLKNYELGGEKTVFIGDNIIEYSHLKLIQKDSINFKAIKNSDTRVKIIEGEIYKVQHKDLDDGSLYIRADGYISGGFYLKISKSGELLDPHPYYKDGLGFHNHAVLNVGQGGVQYFSPMVEKQQEYDSGSFKQEILYAGLSGDTLNMTYKEYKDDIARPAFFQNFTYDIKKSDIIRYKNILIKILEASNSQIRYIVLEDGY